MTLKYAVAFAALGAAFSCGPALAGAGSDTGQELTAVCPGWMQDYSLTNGGHVSRDAYQNQPGCHPASNLTRQAVTDAIPPMHGRDNPNPGQVPIMVSPKDWPAASP